MQSKIRVYESGRAEQVISRCKTSWSVLACYFKLWVLNFLKIFFIFFIFMLSMFVRFQVIH